MLACCEVSCWRFLPWRAFASTPSDWYSKYLAENGRAPAGPGELQLFAQRRGGKITYEDARACIVHVKASSQEAAAALDAESVPANSPATCNPASRIDVAGLSPNDAWSRMSASQVLQPAASSDFAERRPNSVRFVAVSDTHGKHRQVTLPPGDVLMHTGDFTMTGEYAATEDFHAWLAEQQHRFKIVIAGNHDITMDEEFYVTCGAQRFHRQIQAGGRLELSKKVRRILTESQDVVYLEDAMFEIPTAVEGRFINVWGSPYQPEIPNMPWAFNLARGKQTKAKAERIPTEADMLLTHGPPLGRGDLCTSGIRAGCVDMIQEIQSRVKPVAHVFGHVHEGYGASSDGCTTYINPSSCTFKYRATQPAIVFDIEVFPDGGLGAATMIGEVPMPP